MIFEFYYILQIMDSTLNATGKAARNPIRKWFIRILIFLVFFMGLYIYWMYYNAYSRGSRIGRDLKMSTKGNIFKTNEGYLTEGCRDFIGNSPVFTFSVEDEAVEQKLEELQLQPEACFELKYIEYRKILPWRGDSKYVVIDALELQGK